MTRADDALHLWLVGLAGDAASPSGKLADPQLGPEQADGAALGQLMRAHRARREQGAQAPSAVSEAAHWQRVRLKLLPQATAPAESGLVVSAAPAQQDSLGLSPALPAFAPRTTNAPSWRRWAANQPVWAWAAGIAALALLLPWALPALPGADGAGGAGLGDAETGVVMRGGEAHQILLATTPQDAGTLADQLEQVLQAHDVPYRRSSLGDAGWQIQAKVVPHGPVAKALEQRGIVVTNDGLLLLRISSGPELSRPKPSQKPAAVRN